MSAMPTAEVGVIGAGPAGALAAELLARQGVSVLLLDPKAPWEKPCGGGLTPAALDDFPDLTELDSHSRTATEARVELTPERGFSVPLDRPLRIVSRKVLGEWQLARALRAGARHVPTKVRAVRRGPVGWTLETDQDRFRVRFLVGADGAASIVRRVAAPQLSVELAPTRVAYPSSAEPAHDRVVLKFYPKVAGYLWDFPRPGHRSVGVGVQNGTWQRSTLDGEIDAYRRTSDQCGCPGVQRAGAVIGTAQLGHGDYSAIAGPDFALLGDAAGFADPLTGEGIHNAMRSATLLGKAWSNGDVASYPALARATFHREFAIARLSRRLVLESDFGSALIERALTSDAAYAAMDAILNAVNEHDAHVSGLLHRAFRAWRDVRTGRTMPARGGRDVVSCQCTAPGACTARPVATAAASRSA